MRKNLKFDLTVDSNALLCPNPDSFYAKAYITEDIASNYRTLPGIKYKTKIATNVWAGSILQDASCDWSDVNSTLGAIDVDVQTVSAMAELCRFDLEQSFVSLQMAKGTAASFEVPVFMAHYWETMSGKIGEEVEQARWKGNTENAAYTGTSSHLKLVDGYEKILAANALVNDVTASAVTVSNVIQIFSAAYQKLATTNPALVSKTADLRFYAPAGTVAAYRQAVAAGNTLAFVTKNLDLSFLDIKIVVAEGMSANKLVLTLANNMGYAFDGENDGKALEAIDLSKSVAEPKLRTRADLRLGFFITNPEEIVYVN